MFKRLLKAAAALLMLAAAMAGGAGLFAWLEPRDVATAMPTPGPAPTSYSARTSSAKYHEVEVIERLRTLFLDQSNIGANVIALGKELAKNGCPAPYESPTCNEEWVKRIKFNEEVTIGTIGGKDYARSNSDMFAEYLGEGTWLVTLGTKLRDIPKNDRADPASKPIEQWYFFESGLHPTRKR